MDLSRWKGCVAVVTGASSGIGRRVAADLVEEGMRVVGVARRKRKLTELQSSLGQMSELFFPFEADLREAELIPALFARIRAELGGIDVLVNNAGLGYDEPLMTGRIDRWKEMLDVNVLALCACTRESIADMQSRSGSGYVIHISSMSGHRVPGRGGVYTATKHAVKALTEAMRQELRQADSSIRVSAISPGFVETEFAANYHQSEEKAEQVYARYPCLQPEDISRAVRYLLAQPDHVQFHDLLVRPTRQPT
jgi:NADP-dependent 3-hydroxy acid dehydrogenase YdfG